MQAYSEEFARIYNSHWASFANQVAPMIRTFYESTPVGQTNRAVLDLCCGAGHLAAHFLEYGYHLVGVDLSESMLQYARKNNQKYVESGAADFLKADASEFSLDRQFGLVVSTYDSLNHLEHEEALLRCFRYVYEVCDGYFIFDLNTKNGLARWNQTHIDESSEDAFIITRGSYDGQSDKAWIKVTGFTKLSSGAYSRFDETIYNTVFDMSRVREMLKQVGWKDVHFAHPRDLATSLADPEGYGRIFVVAGK